MQRIAYIRVATRRSGSCRGCGESFSPRMGRGEVCKQKREGAFLQSNGAVRSVRLAAAARGWRGHRRGRDSGVLLALHRPYRRQFVRAARGNR